MRALLIFLFIGVAGQVAAGQTPAANGLVQLTLNEIADHLNLTNSQLQSLKAIQSSENQAQQGVFQSISQKQQQLDALLESGDSSAAEIGQLSIDMHTLRKQSTTTFEPYQSQALAVLTPERQAKLVKLSDALQLGSAASQHVMLSLVAPAKPMRPVRCGVSH
jgi:Spy/CpxP family protein refolding chaperone